MRNKKKLGVLLAVMMLGVVTISGSVAKAEEVVEESVQAEQNEVSTQEDKVVKANKQTLEAAQNAMDKKEFEEAIGYLTTYINSKPKNYEAYKLRGECYYELREYKLAQADFEVAVKLKANDDKFVTGAKVFSAVLLGADKQEQYQNPELGNLYALLMYSQKAQNNPAYEGSYMEAGRYNSHIYLPKPNKNDIAKINCPQKYGKKINQSGVNSYIYDAINDIEKGDFHEAVYKIQYITSNYPKYYLGHYLSGVAYVGLEQEKEAVSAFETSLSLNPKDFESLASLGQIYYMDAENTFSKSDVDKSVDYFKKALALNPDCYLYHYYIGLNYLLVNDYSAAADSFNSAIKVKSDDYNSMYYKAISLYMTGDYNAAVDEATNLLFRHVSNCNSVLYLRALANYKLGLNSEAVSDIEKIQNNMNDIYNDDIRVTSAKEQTLMQYLSYLKAKISKDGGFGAVADLNNAFKNPIIKGLDRVSAQDVRAGNVPISLDDIDTQYDYIRTTFPELDLSIAYANSAYELVAKKGVKSAAHNPALVKQSELLLNDGESSIAKLLASNNLESIKPASDESFAKASESELPKEELPVLRAVETDIATPADEVNENPPEKVVTEVPAEDGVKVVAEELKQTEDFTISYEKPEIQPVAEEKVKDVKGDNFTISYPKEETSVKEVISGVTEKHAVIDIAGGNVRKALPEIKDTDEVIELDTESFISKAQSIVKQPPFDIPNQKIVSIEPVPVATKSADVKATQEENTVEVDNIEELQAEQNAEKEEGISLDNVEIRIVDGSTQKTEDELTQGGLGVVETTSANPMLQRIRIPSITAPDKAVKEMQKEVTETLASVAQTTVDVSNPKTIDNKDVVIAEPVEIKEVQEKAAQAQDVIENTLTVADDFNIEMQEVSEPIVKAKKERKHWFKSKKEKVKAQKDEIIDDVLPEISETVTEEKDEAQTVVESVVQTIFNGETAASEKPAVEVSVAESPVADESAAEVAPEEDMTVEEPVVEEKPVKVKKQRVKKERIKKEKPVKIKKVKEEKPLEEVLVPIEEKVENAELDLTPAVTYINPEKPKKVRVKRERVKKEKVKKERVKVEKPIKEKRVKAEKKKSGVKDFFKKIFTRNKKAQEVIIETQE